MQLSPPTLTRQSIPVRALNAPSAAKSSTHDASSIVSPVCVPSGRYRYSRSSPPSRPGVGDPEVAEIRIERDAPRRGELRRICVEDVARRGGRGHGRHARQRRQARSAPVVGAALWNPRRGRGRPSAGSAKGPVSSSAGVGGTSSSRTSKFAPAAPGFGSRTAPWSTRPGSRAPRGARAPRRGTRPPGRSRQEHRVVRDGRHALRHWRVLLDRGAQGLRARRREEDVHAVGPSRILGRRERRRHIAARLRENLDRRAVQTEPVFPSSTLPTTRPPSPGTHAGSPRKTSSTCQ